MWFPSPPFFSLFVRQLVSMTKDSLSPTLRAGEHTWTNPADNPRAQSAILRSDVPFVGPKNLLLPFLRGESRE